MIPFHFQRLQPFEGKSAVIKRPREITEFSFDNKHVCYPLDNRSLRYYYPPMFESPHTDGKRLIDLSQGFETFEKYNDDVNLHLNPLLDTIEAYERQTKSKVQADILTWRGMMTKILTAPFDKFGEFEMNATCFEGTIYIEENQTAKAAQNSLKKRNYQQQQTFSPGEMTFWGYKFETLATLPRPWADCSRDEIEGRETEVVNNYAQYCSVVRTGIGKHVIVIGGEVDAIIGSKPDNPSAQIPYVELKTSENFYAGDSHAARKFEMKLCRFWAQSFLLNVPKIIVGFRSANGILQYLKEWNTLDIPNFVKRHGMNTWDGNICINFAAAFLDFLKEHITGEGTWTIERRKGAKEIMLSKISEAYDKDIVSTKFKEHRASFGFEEP